MKRSMALMVCALSGAMVLGSFSPVMAGKIKTAQTAVKDGEVSETEKADSKEDNQEDTAEETVKEENGTTDSAADTALEDGVYTAEFDTDSGMFAVNEAKEGKGELVVKDGKMTIHVSLKGKGILNLFMGTAEDAKKDGAELLEPTEDEVTYSDGYSEKVYGFDIPVPAIDEEFDVALIGKKDKWYDHKVKVTNPVKTDDSTGEGSEDTKKITAEDLKLEDGSYTVEVTMEGGTGRATIESPAAIEVKDGNVTATIVWSSPNYDYMLVGDKKYEPVNKDGNSAFEIPVDGFDYPMEVTADTVAMSTPHEIDYTLQFDSSSIKEADK
nr:hypothetical protein [uncultured Blautia sp.]